MLGRVGEGVAGVGWGSGVAGMGGRGGSWGRGEGGSWGGVVEGDSWVVVGVSLTLAETRVGKNPVSRKPVISRLVGQR